MHPDANELDKDKLLTNGVFCMLPWVHQFVHTNGDMLPCCVGDYQLPLGNVRESDPETIWNSQPYRELRSNMLNGIESPACNGCYSRRKLHGIDATALAHANHMFGGYFDLVRETNPDGSLPDFNVKSLDIRWSNICNFKCRTCGDWNSSSWAIENRSPNIHLKATGDNASLVERYSNSIGDLAEVYFAGGEPLIMEEHYDMLDRLIAAGNTKLRLRYNTNMSVLSYKSTSVLDLWNLFDDVQLSVSLDSWGERAAYIRHGTDWDVICRNIISVKEKLPHVKIGFNAVVSVFNAMTLPEFMREMERLELTGSHLSSFYMLTQPQHFSAMVLPHTMRNAAADRIDAYVSTLPATMRKIAKKTAAIASNLRMESNLLLKSPTIKAIKEIDGRRSQSFSETFPELRSWFNG